MDILEIAIEKLLSNAKEYGVESNINGIVQSIEAYLIEPKQYDLIIAVSSLEHLENENVFVNKLQEISNGIRPNGVVCLVINSEVNEEEKATGKGLDAQFEVNLPTERVQSLLLQKFEGWTILKTSVKAQEYDIPRETGMNLLKTKVVTFVAQK